MYTIGRVAALTGVPVATLRAWERRYAVVSPARSDGGYRMYDTASIATVNRMRGLVESGWGPKAAASQVRSELEQGDGDGAAEVDPRHLPIVARFLTAATSLDLVELGAALDEMFLATSFEAAVDRRLMPAIQALGDAWSCGDVGVGGEHVASAAVMRRLGTAYEAAGGDIAGPRVVTGLPEGARHEIGLLAFATAARRQGLAVLHLGADLPADVWVEAVATYGADAAVLAVPTTDDVHAARSTINAVLRAHPHVRVFAGGGQQHEVSPPAEPLGHEVAAGARYLAARLAGASRTPSKPHVSPTLRSRP